MPTPPTEDLLTQTRQQLALLQQQITTLQNNYSRPPLTVLTHLTGTRDRLLALDTKLQADTTRLQAYEDALVDPNNSNLAAWENALEMFEIELTVASGGLGSDDTGWDKDEERVKAAYRSVYRIINKISSGLFGNDKGKAILQFIDTFGGTALQLTLERSSGTTPYAETANPGGGTIFLYTAPTRPWTIPDDTRGYIVHTAENITHEFGHVLAFRNGSDNSDMFQEWDDLRQYISEFDTTDGWSTENFAKLQNKSTLSDGLPGSELENERIANMFEAVITGYQPDLSATNSKQLRAAWAMWTFMSGECPPDDVNIDLTGQVRPCGNGFYHWIETYGQ